MQLQTAVYVYIAGNNGGKASHIKLADSILAVHFPGSRTLYTVCPTLLVCMHNSVDILVVCLNPSTKYNSQLYNNPNYTYGLVYLD